MARNCELTEIMEGAKIGFMSHSDQQAVQNAECGFRGELDVRMESHPVTLGLACWLDQLKKRGGGPPDTICVRGGKNCVRYSC